MADNRLVFELRFDAKDTDKAFDGVNKSGQEAGKKAGASFAKSFRNTIGRQIGAIASFEVIRRTISSATQSAIQFQTALTEINTILPKNQKVSEKTADQFREFAETFGKEQTQQAKAFYQIVSAGVTDTAQATDLLANANKLAVGGVANLNGSIDILTTAVNSYGQENLSAQEAADALFTAVRLGKTTVDELSSSLGLALTPANQAGITFDEVAASIALLTSRGISTNRAVTNLNGLITALARNAAKLGPEFERNAIEANGLVQTLQTLQQRTGGSNAKILELLGSQEALIAAQVLLVNNGQDLNNTLGQFSNKAGAAGDAFRQVADTDAFRLQQATEKLNVTLERLGTTILPTVADGLQIFADVLDTITLGKLAKEAGDANQELLKEIRQTESQVEELEGSLRAVQKGEDTGFGFLNFFSDSPEEIQAELDKTRKKLELLKQTRQNFIKGIDDSGAPGSSVVNESTPVTGQGDSGKATETTEEKPEFNSLIGLNDEEKLRQQFENNLETLRQGLGEQEGVENEFRQRKLELERQYKEQLDQLRLEQEANQQASFENIAAGFEASAQSQTVTAKKLAGVVNSTLSRGFSNAFNNVGVALRNGENGFEAFSQGIQSIFGDIASATGDVYIAQGVAELFRNPATGSGLIAAGGALKVLGAALGGGGGAGAGARPSGAPTDPITTAPAVPETSPLIDEGPEERAETQSQVVVNVDRFVGEDEEARRLADIISDAGAKSGLLLTDVRGRA